jgi:hypothetical protein
VVFDAASNTGWAATDTTGAKAYDTATVTTTAGITATGTVTYTLFPNNACAPGTGGSAGTVTLNADGTVPNSNTEGPFKAGTYGFQAVYSGDSDVAGATSSCETFTVAAGTSRTATTVFDSP